MKWNKIKQKMWKAMDALSLSEFAFRVWNLRQGCDSQEWA